MCTEARLPVQPNGGLSRGRDAAQQKTPSQFHHHFQGCHPRGSVSPTTEGSIRLPQRSDFPSDRRQRPGQNPPSHAAQSPGTDSQKVRSPGANPATEGCPPRTPRTGQGQCARGAEEGPGRRPPRNSGLRKGSDLIPKRQELGELGKRSEKGPVGREGSRVLGPSGVPPGGKRSRWAAGAGALRET